MQVEGVRRAWSQGGRGQRDLDGGVGWERVDGARWKEVLRGLRTAQDLEEHRDGRRRESRVVDEEVGAVLRHRMLSAGSLAWVVETLTKLKARLSALSTPPGVGLPG